MPFHITSQHITSCYLTLYTFSDWASARQRSLRKPVHSAVTFARHGHTINDSFRFRDISMIKLANSLGFDTLRTRKLGISESKFLGNPSPRNSTP